ncbi:unnamed protein product, partial [Pelagomonas calceolata]
SRDKLYLLLSPPNLSVGPRASRRIHARGRHHVRRCQSHGHKTLERRLGVGDGLRLRFKRLGGARVRHPGHEALAPHELVDLARRQGREVDAFQLLACIVLDDEVWLFPGLEVDDEALVAVGVARLLDEALHLLQFVELSATTRLDAALRGERRRRDEQQPASGRGFSAAAMRANDSIDFVLASGARAYRAGSRQAVSR